MPAELHIRIHQDAEDPDNIIESFPFESDQRVVLQSMQLVVVDLGAANDTNYVQDWYLNGHDDVASFFVVSDEAPDAEEES